MIKITGLKASRKLEPAEMSRIGGGFAEAALVAAGQALIASLAGTRLDTARGQASEGGKGLVFNAI